MSLLLFLRIEEGPFPVQFAVVTDLKGIAADKDRCRADKFTQYSGVPLEHIQIHRIRRITGHDEQDRDPSVTAARCLNVVGMVLKDQPFKKTPESC